MPEPDLQTSYGEMDPRNVSFSSVESSLEKTIPGKEGGQLWTWGMGRNGKYDRLTSNLCEPRSLTMPNSANLPFSSITSIACSSSHALFTTRTPIPQL